MISPYVFPGVMVKPKKLNQHARKRNFIQFTRAVCSEYNVRPQEIHSQSRFTNFRVPRQVMHTLLRELTGMTIQEIGFLVGRRNHATVLHSVRAVKSQYQTDKIYRDKLNEVLYGIGAEHLKTTLMQ